MGWVVDCIVSVDAMVAMQLEQAYSVMLDARDLIDRAEWVLGSVSLLTLLISIWVSFALPREVVDLANSVRNLVTHVREERAEMASRPT